MSFSLSHVYRVSILFIMMLLTACAAQRPAVIQATVNNDTQALHHLLEKGSDPNVRDTKEHFGRSALYWAARAGNNDLVKQLIKSGADVNQVGVYGFPPIFAALAKQGNTETFNLLIDAGADIHLRAKDGETSLMMAVYGDKPDLVKTLIIRGVDPHIKTNNGYTAYTLAKDNLAKNKNAKVTPDLLEQLYQNYLKEKKNKDFEQRVKQIEQLDANLNISLRHDKYLIAYTDALKRNAFEQAVLYANLLDRLDLSKEDAFYYFWGEALLKTGQPDQAKEKLNQYIQKAGSEGKYYTQALRLIIQAEEPSLP